MAIAKVSCKCYKCKVDIEAGDNVEWYKRTISSGEHIIKSYARFHMVCTDKEACRNRVAMAFDAKQAAYKQKEAQDMLNFMRKQGMDDVFCNQIIVQYAAQGIVVK